MQSELAERLQQVRAAVARAATEAGRDPAEITLIGVTKTVAAERVAEAIDAGLSELGENRVQEALGKMEALAEREVNWHLIGSLQTNKVKYILPRVKLIHSLDRFNLAQELDRRAEKLQLQAHCLVEVNVAREASKSGLALGEVSDFVQTVVQECPHVNLHGMMTVAPYADNPEEVRGYFRQMRQLFDRLADEYRWQHLSMGMSNDFRVAIAEGATMVRIGTAIFGRR